MIDFHSHVLPCIDDGSRNVPESVEMLKESFHQGVGTVIATPHFSADRETVDEFLLRRQTSHMALLEGITDSVPEILLGAEVRYYDGISHMQDLAKLRVENSRLLLLEMPMRRWTEYAVKDVCDIACRGNITVVLAHIERYLPFQSKSVIQRFLENGILFQVSADFFTGVFSRHRAMKMLTREQIHFVGSDAHNTTTRPPNMKGMAEAITRVFGQDGKEHFINECREIFEQNKLK